MHPYVAEFVGTALLILLGNGVVANVVLTDTKGHGAGWIAITAGWGLAVFVAVLCTAEFSGAHINPAVTLGTAVAGTFAWSLVPGYIAAQLLGAFAGATLVFMFYHQHFARTDDADSKFACFATAPAIRAAGPNFAAEVIGTFVLVFAVLYSHGAVWHYREATAAGMTAASGTIGLGSLGALPVGLIVFSIGVSLGGTTGYAINPARDFAPRLAHALLPVPRKRNSDWSYAWIPIAGPLLGAVLAAGASLAL
ncbi:MAG: aquaporin family protein [Planctomycetota bacterium]|nr:MAG: aquaporin family protein [Planctomycetota bacterium]